MNFLSPFDLLGVLGFFPFGFLASTLATVLAIFQLFVDSVLGVL